MTALVYLLILAFVSVSASDNTCNGLEKVVMNTDLSRLLSDCARDESCSRVSCRAAGIIALSVDSVIITLKLCEIPGSPGVTIEFLKNGRALINQTVTAPTNVTKDLGISTVNAYVFVNSTANTLGLSIDPVIVTTNQLNASRSEQMITFTQIPISRSQCDSVTVSAQDPATCSGLDQLAQNANPSMVSDCARDSNCTRVTCQVTGIINLYVSSAIFTLQPMACGTPQGVRIQLLPSSGEALVDQIITSPTAITRTLSGIATATMTVFVNSTINTVGISVDPVTVNTFFFGSTSDYLLRFTSVHLACQTAGGTQGLSTTTTTADPVGITQVQTATTPAPKTCSGLDQLAQNANPSMATDCARDSNCTRVTCQATGRLTAYVSSAIFTLQPMACGTPQGVRIQLLPSSGEALVDQTITSPTVINRTLGSIATATMTVFVNSTINTVGISVDPVTINAGFLGSASDYLISYTSIALPCQTHSGTSDSVQRLVTTTTTAEVGNVTEMRAGSTQVQSSNAALGAMLSFKVSNFLLTSAVMLFINMQRQTDLA